MVVPDIAPTLRRGVDRNRTPASEHFTGPSHSHLQEAGDANLLLSSHHILTPEVFLRSSKQTVNRG